MNSCKLVCFLLLQAVTVHALRLFSPNAFGFSGQEQLLPVSRCTALQSIKPNRGGYIEAEGSGSPCRIKVIGVGGGGGNAVNRMMESTTGVLGVEMWAVNTDAQALSRNLATNKLNIGSRTSRGLGAGGSPNVGATAAKESREEINEIVQDADLVFVTAGMGGGTGSGAAPVVAECAKSAGALTIGVVTKPFAFEGKRRMDQAKGAIAEMKDKVDTLIVVSNDRLLQIVPENTPLKDAFLVADDILRQGVVGISEIIIKPGLVNVDFADVRTIMGNAGTALMGIGQGKGKTRAVDAAMAAISSPLLDFPITKAKGIVFNIVGGSDMSLQEINSAADVIYQNVDVDANIIFGALVDDRMTNGEVSITVLATGFETDYFEASEGRAENTRASPLKNNVNVRTKLALNTLSSSSSQDEDDSAELAPRSKSSQSASSQKSSSSNGGRIRQPLPTSLNKIPKSPAPPTSSKSTSKTGKSRYSIGEEDFEESFDYAGRNNNNKVVSTKGGKKSTSAYDEEEEYPEEADTYGDNYDEEYYEDEEYEDDSNNSYYSNTRSGGASSSKKTVNSADSKRYKGFRGFFRKLFRR